MAVNLGQLNVHMTCDCARGYQQDLETPVKRQLAMNQERWRPNEYSRRELKRKTLRRLQNACEIK